MALTASCQYYIVTPARGIVGASLNIQRPVEHMAGVVGGDDLLVAAIGLVAVELNLSSG